jgi:hypothetical protein
MQARSRLLREGMRPRHGSGEASLACCYRRGGPGAGDHAATQGGEAQRVAGGQAAAPPSDGRSCRRPGCRHGDHGGGCCAPRPVRPQRYGPPVIVHPSRHVRQQLARSLTDVRLATCFTSIPSHGALGEANLRGEGGAGEGDASGMEGGGDRGCTLEHRCPRATLSPCIAKPMGCIVGWPGPIAPVLRVTAVARIRAGDVFVMPELRRGTPRAELRSPPTLRPAGALKAGKQLLWLTGMPAHAESARSLLRTARAPTRQHLPFRVGRVARRAGEVPHVQQQHRLTSMGRGPPARWAETSYPAARRGSPRSLRCGKKAVMLAATLRRLRAPAAAIDRLHAQHGAQRELSPCLSACPSPCQSGTLDRLHTHHSLHAGARGHVLAARDPQSTRTGSITEAE